MMTTKLNMRDKDLSVQARRRQRYRDEADPVYLKAVEDAALAATTPDLTQWLATKTQIRSELPYSE